MRGAILLFVACAASVVGYAAIFGLLLDRPLGLAPLGRQIEARLRLGEAAAAPKLVILAGSNGPYSHRCEVIGAMLGMACVNGGIAVGIGLDYLFARWRPLLRPGDVVYMPMETAQYIRSRSATRVGPDAAIMLRHDRATLAGLPADRWAGALVLRRCARRRDDGSGKRGRRDGRAGAARRGCDQRLGRSCRPHSRHRARLDF